MNNLQDNEKKVGINTLTKCKLGDILDVRRGTSLSGNFYSETGSKIRLTLGNFNYPSGGFKENISKTDIYFTGDVKPEFILKKDDIITPLTEQVAGLLGETAVIPKDNLYIQSGDIGLVIPDEDVLDKTFARYLVSSPIVKKQLSAAAQQTKIRHTTPDGIKDCDVWIPSLQYQRFAGKLLDTIDTKIKANKKIISELEALAKTIYDYWFVQFDFPDENGNPYHTSGGEMVYNETLKREIPKGWKVGTFYDIAKFINGIACQKFRPQGKDKGLPVIKIREMHEGISSNTEYVTSNLPIQYIINDGDLLFSWSGSLEVMFWSNGRGGLNQHIFKVNPIENYPIEFIYQQLKSYVVVFQKMAESRKTTMGHITTDHLGQSKILLPPRETLKAYETIAKPVRTMVLKYEIEARQLAILREWMLPMLMNGQLSFQAQSDSDTVDVTQEEVGAHD